MALFAVFLFCFAAMVINSDAKVAGKLRNDESVEIPKPYTFGYNLTDNSGSSQHREEIANEKGQVIGKYGFRDTNGTYREVEYTADENGFRVIVKSNEPGMVKQNNNPNVLYA